MKANSLEIIEVLSNQPSLSNMRAINILAKYLQGNIAESAAISTANTYGFILIPTPQKKRYKDSTIHYTDSPCNPRTPYPVVTSPAQIDVTCKRCKDILNNQ